MNKTHIVCVGAGVSGTATFIALIRLLEQHPDLARTVAVTVVDRSADFGPGMPYGRSTAEIHLLNMRAGTMSLILDEPDDFVDWLAAQGPIPEVLPRGRRDMLARRHRYGEYTRLRFSEYTQRALAIGATVTLSASDARDLRLDDHGDRIGVVLAGDEVLWADKLLVATGHWDPVDTDHCVKLGAELAEEGKGALLYPWPAAQLADTVPPGQTIGVLGTSLTAVDAWLTIGYAQGEFTELSAGRYAYRPDVPFTIVACSRRGLLPAIQIDGVAVQSDEPNPYLAAAALPELDEDPADLSVSNVIRRYEAASAWLAKQTGTVLPGLSTADTDGRSAHALLRASLAAWEWRDQAEFELQELARGFFAPLWWMYQRMSRQRRAEVWQEFMTPFLVRSAAIPVENAARVEALMAAGVLRIRSGIEEVVPDDGHFRLTFREGDPLAVTYLVNAIGRGGRLGVGAEFAAAAVGAGLLVPELSGGIRVEPETSLALDQQDRIDRRVAVLGQLTMGSHIGASAAASCVKRATAVAREWIADLVAVAEMGRES